MTTEQALLEGFIDDSPAPEPAGPPPIIVDRSTLERYSQCPHQGLLIERKAVSSGNELTDVGDEVHAILSAACRNRHQHGLSPKELRESIEAAALSSRPDVQPEVIQAVRRAYPIV